MKKYGLLYALVIVCISVQYCSIITAMEKDSHIVQIEEMKVSKNKTVPEILKLKGAVQFQAVTRHQIAQKVQESRKKTRGRKVNPTTQIKTLEETLEQVIDVEDGLTNELGDLCTEAQKTFNKDRVKGIAITLAYLLSGGGSLGGALYYTKTTDPNISISDKVTGAVPLYTAALGFFYQGYTEFQKVWGNDYIKDKINDNATKIKFIADTKAELENNILRLQRSMRINTKPKKSSNQFTEIDFSEPVKEKRQSDEFNELSKLEVIQEDKKDQN